MGAAMGTSASLKTSVLNPGDGHYWITGYFKLFITFVDGTLHVPRLYVGVDDS